MGHQKYIIPILIFIVSWGGSSVQAQQTFPDSYIGQWEGELKIYSGNRMVKEVTMRLLIENTSLKDTYIYNLVYQGDNEPPDARNYLLKVIDKKLGQFEIDEQNTVVLPMQLFGQKLVSSFVVEGSIVHFMYELMGDHIGVEVLSGPYEQANYTGEQLGVPQVGILNNQIFQVGKLYLIE